MKDKKPKIKKVKRLVVSEKDMTAMRELLDFYMDIIFENSHEEDGDFSSDKLAKKLWEKVHGKSYG